MVLGTVLVLWVRYLEDNELKEHGEEAGGGL
jgi:hypothetical protein